jgi:hypothetical protein
MPLCILWDEADWQFAKDTLEVAARFYAGNGPAGVELRKRQALMGFTVDARRDLRIRYVDSLPEEERLGVAAIEDYRERLRPDGSDE